MRRARWKRKNVRRVGLRRRRPPAAGGGWLAVPCRSQGRKRPALGETSGPGKSGIHPAPLFAAAGRWLMRVAAWANATTSTPARAARSEAERAEREAGQMRPCTPTRSAPSATGRQLQKLQKTQACPKVRQNRRLHRYADPRRAEGYCTGARQRFSLWTVHGPFLFWQDKREMGGASWLDKPPAGADTPVANLRRPIPFQGVPNAIQLRCSLRPSR